MNPRLLTFAVLGLIAFALLNAAKPKAEESALADPPTKPVVESPIVDLSVVDPVRSPVVKEYLVKRRMTVCDGNGCRVVEIDVPSDSQGQGTQSGNYSGGSFSGGSFSGGSRQYLFNGPVAQRWRARWGR